MINKDDTDININEWSSIFFQIISILIMYQNKFSFTHNDLHSGNIVYNETEQKFIYYKIENKLYKVPTFGKIYKIIDFGRAIYTYDNHIFCSDAFNRGEDADTQYNCEPFFNESKPRIEPNYSFDLCRLGCSIFDYFFDDIDEIDQISNKNVIASLILEWCQDDNKKSVLYRKNGQERYPDFRLYKMIARNVHNHVPLLQLERPIFSQFIIDNVDINDLNDINNNIMQIM
jgi:hypothetical protein